IEHPVPFTILVLVAPYEKLDKRKGITKKLHKHSTVIDCQPLEDKALRSWMKEIADSFEIDLTEETNLLLESEYAGNLYMLQKENFIRVKDCKKSINNAKRNKEISITCRERKRRHKRNSG